MTLHWSSSFRGSLCAGHDPNSSVSTLQRNHHTVRWKTGPILSGTSAYSHFIAHPSLLSLTASQDEDQGWSMNIDELARSLSEARQSGADVRALCVINPGNPTGQVLTADVMRDV